MTDVNVSVEFLSGGQVKLTFGPVDPDDVDELLTSVGTDEFKNQLISNLEGMLR